MTIEEMIAVLEAAKEGKKIEFQDIMDPGTWWASVSPGWDFLHFRYRVKPELIERWAVITSDGEEVTFEFKKNATLFHEDNPGSRLVHLREVKS